MCFPRQILREIKNVILITLKSPNFDFGEFNQFYIAQICPNKNSKPVEFSELKVLIF